MARAAHAKAALAQTPDAQLGPAARLLTAGQAESSNFNTANNADNDLSAPHQGVRAFLAERAREALPLTNPAVIASTPSGSGVLPDGTPTTYYRYLEMAVTAVQTLLADNDALRAQLAVLLGEQAATSDAEAGRRPTTGEKPLPNAWMVTEFARAQERTALLPPGARPVVTLLHRPKKNPAGR